MKAYHNDFAIKEKFVQRFAAHRAADEVVQGLGFANGNGCFVGCALDKYDHSRFPKELGWPEWLAHLADAIFEELPKSEAAQFGTDILNAVPVGANLEPVQFLLAIARHERQLVRLRISSAPYALECVSAIEKVVAWCKLRVLKPSRVLKNLAREVELSAYAATDLAYPAALLASDSAYAAARSASDSAYSAARSASGSMYSASDSLRYAARSAAGSSEFMIERDTLLRLLATAKAN